MDVLEALRTRRSIGRVDGDVCDDEVRALLDVAVCAPNHRLTEPWRFTVLRGRARERLGEVWRDAVARETPLAGDERDAFLRREAAKPLRAPVLIAASVRTEADPVVAEEDFAATAAAVQNMLLAAHALGLGAMWRTGAMTRTPEVLAHLDLDPADRIVGIVYLGRVAGEPPKPRERAADGVTRWRD